MSPIRIITAKPGSIAERVALEHIHVSETPEWEDPPAPSPEDRDYRSMLARFAGDGALPRKEVPYIPEPAHLSARASGKSSMPAGVYLRRGLPKQAVLARLRIPCYDYIAPPLVHPINPGLEAL